MKLWEEKMRYFNSVIESGVRRVLEGGQFDGLLYNGGKSVNVEDLIDDIERARKIYVDVSLINAIDAIKMGDRTGANIQLEAAIGYLMLLHYKINEKSVER